MIPILAAIIVLVTTGLFVWTISSFLDAIARFRRTKRWDEQYAEIGRASR
jgi:hypothetical protein